MERLAAGKELNEKTLAGVFLNWMAHVMLLSLGQYVGNGMINSTLMVGGEHCGFPFSVQERSESDGHNRRWLRILSAS